MLLSHTAYKIVLEKYMYERLWDGLKYGFLNPDLPIKEEWAFQHASRAVASDTAATTETMIY